VNATAFLRRLRADCRGSVAVETAIVAAFLGPLILQVVDVGWYLYCRMQVRMAAQAAAAEAAITCNTTAMLPISTNCTGISAKMTTAAQKMPLGNKVTISTTTEHYYCVDPTTGALVDKGTTKPTCATAPADIVSVTTTYDFSSIFPGMSVASYFPKKLTADAWMRVG
jgi:Flp pilus assembly protein TadG